MSEKEEVDSIMPRPSEITVATAAEVSQARSNVGHGYVKKRVAFYSERRRVITIRNTDGVDIVDVIQALTLVRNFTSVSV